MTLGQLKDELEEEAVINNYEGFFGVFKHYYGYRVVVAGRGAQNDDTARLCELRFPVDGGSVRLDTHFSFKVGSRWVNPGDFLARMML